MSALPTSGRVPPGLAKSWRLGAAAIAAVGLAASIAAYAVDARRFAFSYLVGFAFVATTFGVDLYRAYRNMNSDVLYAALLVAAAISLRYSARLPAGGATAPVRDA
jgi:hypothetical protein